jgi:hypothetical protein
MARRKKSALAVCLLLLLLCLVPLAAAGGPTGLPAWGTEPSPNAGFERNAFAGVDALSTTDAWAVGHYHQGGFNHPRPLVQRWNGSTWSIVPPSWTEEGELFGVAAIAPNDAWMVGGYQQGGEALIAHWDGNSITTVPHPNPGAFNRLYAVTAVSANDVWAVGEFTDPISKTLALHWNGSQWTQVPTPNGEGYNQLNGVTAVASDDVWAVGEDGNGTLSLHWDGSQWTRVATPSPGSYAMLRAVSATTAGEVWAVGDSGPDSLTMRWDGTQWIVVPSPSPGVQFLDLKGVAAISQDDVWAVGVYDFGGNWKSLTMHWDGVEWTVVGAPSPDPTLNELSAVAGVTGTSIVSVGWGGATGSLALAWDGQSWSRQPSANAGTGNNVLTDISVGSPNDIWAVGNAQQRSLTMHYDGSAWSIVPSPNLDFGVRLEGVVTLANADAWAVGWSGSAGSLDDKNVAMHWNGKAWSVVGTPQPGGLSGDRLLAIDAAGPNDVWATGVFWGDQLPDRSLILHWNGSAWSVVPHDCDTYGGLTGISVISATDIWAVGNQTTCHFDGANWTEVPSPQPRLEYNEIAYPLEDVSAAAPNDVWAVGARVIDGPFVISYDGLAEHWNGVEWTLELNIPGTLLLGVEAVTPNDVWAVGTNSYGPLIIHYDGSAWSEVPTPEFGRGGRLSGIDSEPSIQAGLRAGPSSQLWAAGHLYSGTSPSSTLIQRAPSPTQGAVVGGTNVSGATVSWFGPESGSTETNVYGDYSVGGLLAGTYTFIATHPGCTPDVESVTVVAGQTLQQDLQIDCGASVKRQRSGWRPW